jgi:hypothetical protein
MAKGGQAFVAVQDAVRRTLVEETEAFGTTNSNRRLQFQDGNKQDAGFANQRGALHFGLAVRAVKPQATSRPPNAKFTPTASVCWCVISSPRHLPFLKEYDPV